MKERETEIDHEFQKIAGMLLKKYPRFFPDDFSLKHFVFIRTSGIQPKWVARIRRCGHPWGSLPGLEDIIYLIETAHDRWCTLNDAQRALVVFHELKHVAPGGCDFESDSCGKLVDHPIQDFPECIAAANGNLFWPNTGHGDIPNILEETSSFNLDVALRNAGYVSDQHRQEFEKPNEHNDDIASSLAEQIKKRQATQDKEEVTVDEV